MANIKVSEMTEATSFDNGDYTMIIQANQNKKISKENIFSNLEDEISTNANDISTINNNIGNLENLETVDNTNIVNSINTLVPKSLYYNETGSNGSITLSDSVENYEYIEIFYRQHDNINYKSSVKIKNPNGAYANLLYCLTSGAGNTLYINSKNIYIEGNTISIQNNIRYSLVTLSSSVSHNNSNTLYIIEVLGYVKKAEENNEI